MSDFLLEVAQQLDAEPDVCPCGHRWSQHVDGAGCMAMANDWTETALCDCVRGPGEEERG